MSNVTFLQTSIWRSGSAVGACAASFQSQPLAGRHAYLELCSQRLCSRIAAETGTERCQGRLRNFTEINKLIVEADAACPGIMERQFYPPCFLF
eukprot:g21462.t1